MQAPPTVVGSHQAGASQSCEGTWATWAGQQPSASLYGFDGYQWLLDGVPMAGQTHQFHTPTADEIGHQLSCRIVVTYPLLQVTVPAVSSAATVLVPTPTLAGLRQSHRKWREGNKLASIARNRAPVGDTFAFYLNTPATLRLTFTGKVGRHKLSGTLKLAGRVGRERIFFDGRLSRHKRLRPGRYKLVIVATNTAGQSSRPYRLSFTIVR